MSCAVSNDRTKLTGSDVSDTCHPHVAVVIVNYQTPQQTIDCVRSFREVEYPVLSILVVDNASGDDSHRRFREEIPETEVIVAEENGGYTAGNNLGMRVALERRADYIHVVNPDTVVMNPGYITEMVDFMEARADLGALGPRVHLRQQGNVQNTVLRFPWFWRRVVDWFATRLRGRKLLSGDSPVQAEVLNGVCVLFRSSCLEDVGLFDERTFAYIEDVEWSYRSRAKGWRRMYAPIDSVLHLQKEAGYERGSTVEFLLKRNTLYFLLRTRRWFQAAAYTAATLGHASARVAMVLMLARRRTVREGKRRPSPLTPLPEGEGNQIPEEKGNRPVGEGKRVPVGERSLERLQLESQKQATWVSSLARSYVNLWRGRWDRAMGRPEVLR